MHKKEKKNNKMPQINTYNDMKFLYEVTKQMEIKTERKEKPTLKQIVN